MSIHELYYFARGRNEVGGVNQPILVYLVMEENEGHVEGSLLVVNDNSAMLDVSMLFSSSNLCPCSVSVHPSIHPSIHPSSRVPSEDGALTTPA